jgi:hypothetical protein
MDLGDDEVGDCGAVLEKLQPQLTADRVQELWLVVKSPGQPVRSVTGAACVS